MDLRWIVNGKRLIYETDKFLNWIALLRNDNKIFKEIKRNKTFMETCLHWKHFLYVMIRFTTPRFPFQILSQSQESWKLERFKGQKCCCSFIQKVGGSSFVAKLGPEEGRPYQRYGQIDKERILKFSKISNAAKIFYDGVLLLHYGFSSVQVSVFTTAFFYNFKRALKSLSEMLFRKLWNSNRENHGSQVKSISPSWNGRSPHEVIPVNSLPLQNEADNRLTVQKTDLFFYCEFYL